MAGKEHFAFLWVPDLEATVLPRSPATDLERKAILGVVMGRLNNGEGTNAPKNSGMVCYCTSAGRNALLVPDHKALVVVGMEPWPHSLLNAVFN